MIQRDDDKPEAVRKRLQTYEANIKPILDYYNHHGVLKLFEGRFTNEIWPKVHEYVILNYAPFDSSTYVLFNHIGFCQKRSRRNLIDLCMRIWMPCFTTQHLVQFWYSNENVILVEREKFMFNNFNIPVQKFIVLAKFASIFVLLVFS